MPNLSTEERLSALESDMNNVPRSAELPDLVNDLIYNQEFIDELAKRVAKELKTQSP